jgi:hypothetical protein
MIKIVFAGMICCLAGAASAQGFGFGFSTGAGPHYPAEPQYQYPFNEPRAQSVKKCRKGEVRRQGKCRPAPQPARPL